MLGVGGGEGGGRKGGGEGGEFKSQLGQIYFLLKLTIKSLLRPFSPSTGPELQFSVSGESMCTSTV